MALNHQTLPNPISADTTEHVIEEESVNSLNRTTVMGSQEAPRNSNHRIPRAEIQHVLDDAQRLLQDNIGSTRSQSNENAATSQQEAD